MQRMAAHLKYAGRTALIAGFIGRRLQ